MDAYEMWERHDREKERFLRRMPECCECGDNIQDEHFYDICGEFVCEDCLRDYMRKNYRKKTENYMKV